MKKFAYSLLGLGAMLATSCSMDLEPTGVILDDVAVESAQDCFMFRNGIYGNLRALSTGGYISYPEMQMDGFLGLITNGNRLGPINTGNITSADSDMEGCWGGLYSAIADVNFFLNHAQELVESGKLDAEDVADVNHYIAEARFGRAFFYYWLVDHYCPNYTDDNKGKNLGLPLVDHYAPSADKSTYKGRATLEETYNFIKADLNAAYEGLQKVEETDKSAIRPMSNYLCTWTVKSLQARIALLQRDFRTAYNLANEVINSGVYTLSTRSDYAAMWTTDTNNELIFRPASSKSELGISSTGSAWIGASDFQADYMPVPELVQIGPSDLFDSERDIRYTTFFSERKLLSDGQLILVPIFVKYPGNPTLMQTSTPNLMNMAKPFRLSEQYLIAAEAAQELGMESEAFTLLMTLRKNRISRFTEPSPYTGTTLRDEIRKERRRELLGEGFRLSDLRRWGLGFNRSDVNYLSYPMAATVVVAASREVVYQPNDYRYTWPIPSAELQVNPQIAGQQNPGY